MNKKKNDKLIDNYQKEALQGLDNTQTFLFMKKSYKEFLDSSFDFKKESEILTLEEMEKLQHKHHIEYFSIFKEQNINKALMGEYGIFEATFEKLIEISVKEQSKSMLSKSMRLNFLIMMFIQYFSNLSDCLTEVYFTEELNYKYGLKELKEEEKQILKEYQSKLQNQVFNINRSIENNYSFCLDIIERIESIQNEFKDKDMLEECFEPFDNITHLSEETNRLNEKIKNLMLNTCNSYNIYSKYIDEFNSLSEDGFILIRNLILKKEFESNLPKNYVYNMEEFKVEKRAFISD